MARGRRQRRGPRRSAGEDLNIWEASWCGQRPIVAVAGSDGADEGAWYERASRSRSTLTTGADRVLTSSDVQLGWAQGSPDGAGGRRDRGRLQRPVRRGGPAPPRGSGLAARDGTIDTAGVDVSWSGWRGPGRAVRDRTARHSTPWRWRSTPHPAHVRETWVWTEGVRGVLAIRLTYRRPAMRSRSWSARAARPTTVIVVEAGADQPWASTSTTPATSACGRRSAARERVTWTAPGRPGDRGTPHGALAGRRRTLSRSCSRARRADRATTDHMPVGAWSGSLLDREGTRSSSPNPRGSSGRGREFAAMVVGDMGGR